jgi:hypothetical protein
MEIFLFPMTSPLKKSLLKSQRSPKAGERMFRMAHALTSQKDIYRLPLELRFMILRYTFHSRNIEIRPADCTSRVLKFIPSLKIRIPRGVTARKFVSHLSNTKAPAALHVWEESRAEALRFYKIVFRIQSTEDTGKPSWHSTHIAGGIYIHPALNRICPYPGLGTVDFFLQGMMQPSNRIFKHLALSIDTVRTNTHPAIWERFPRHGFSKWLEGLKEIVIYDESMLRKEKDPFAFELVDTIRPQDRLKIAGKCWRTGLIRSRCVKCLAITQMGGWIWWARISFDLVCG